MKVTGTTIPAKEAEATACVSNANVEVGYAQLHTELFLAGKNFNVKLDPHQNKDLKLHYDQANKELLVSYRGFVAHIPSTNVVCYIPGAPIDRKIRQSASTQISNIAQTAQVQVPAGVLTPSPMPKVAFNPTASAQVSTPQSHVHAGLGHGQTGQAPK